MRVICCTLLLAWAACGRSNHEGGSEHEHGDSLAEAEGETHVVRGQYLFHGTQDSTTTVTINHEEIPGFMDAMAMPYVIRDLELVEGLTPGQDIEFRVVVESGGFYFVDRIVPVEGEEPRRSGFNPRSSTTPDVESAPAGRP